MFAFHVFRKDLGGRLLLVEAPDRWKALELIEAEYGEGWWETVKVFDPTKIERIGEPTCPGLETEPGSRTPTSPEQS